MPAESRGAPFHIGELAARTGRTVHAIRWYETQGLVPGVARDEGGRRLYGEPHVGMASGHRPPPVPVDSPGPAAATRPRARRRKAAAAPPTPR